jgi:NAD(P)-dependent dehydrogenase (short-subunit alcohol dehydrogenase family)
MSVQFSFAGQVTVITGGATGLGLATATAFGRAGATIALHDRTPDRAEAACTSLRTQNIACHPYPADVRDGAAIAAMVASIEHDLGRLDIAIANAGIYPNTPFLDLDEVEWRRVIDTNLTGTFLTCQAAARAMVRGGRGGCIITLSSGAANSAIWGWSHYCASKAGVVLLTKAMSLELASHNIRVNTILPGYIDVPEGGAHLATEYKDRARGTIPLGRPGTPDDIANAALLLASPLSDYLTGTTLVVDGGSSAGRIGLRPVGE